MKETQKASRDDEAQRKAATTDTASGSAADEAQSLHASIALLAYRRAQDRNFEPGHELDDWLDAEAEILAQSQSMKGFPA